jgi:tetratricopeptide (TPR) repeat protein
MKLAPASLFTRCGRADFHFMFCFKEAVKMRIRILIVGFWLLVSAPWLHAQVMGEVNVRREGENAIVEAKFDVPIQIRRTVVFPTGDLVQVFYELVGAIDTLSDQRDTTTRRVSIGAGHPDITIIDQDNPGEHNRRVLVRMEKPLHVKVSAGKGNRSIEFLFSAMIFPTPERVPLPGPASTPKAAEKGASAPASVLPKAAVSATRQLADKGKPYSISLNRSSRPVEFVQPVPAALQDYNVFSSQRTVDGKVIHEWRIGYFSDRSEAERALSKLGGFPQATILGPQPDSAGVAATRPVETAPRAPASAAAPLPKPGESAAEPAKATDNEQRFSITLQSSTSEEDLFQPVPAALQDYEVFSSQRTAEGKTVFEWRVGFFSDRGEAEQALRKLTAFPKATIVAPQAAVSAVAATRPAETAIAPTVPAVPAVAVVKPAEPAVVAAVNPVEPVIAAVKPAPPAAAVVKPAEPAMVVAKPAEPAMVVAKPAEPAVAATVKPATPAIAATRPVEPVPVAATPTTLPAAQLITASNEVESQARQLYATAKAAYEVNNYPAAVEALNQLLNLPPNSQSRDAQELIAMSRLRSGDVPRARAELKAYLALYPTGEGAERIKREMGGLPPLAEKSVVEDKPKPEIETTTSGSTSLYYYGGNGQTRSQDFKDSAIAGLPTVPGEATLSADKFQQMYADVDLNWRRRDADSDMRMVFRDSYTKDLQNSDKSKNRLSSAYFDYKGLLNGVSTRIGRQSPTGGGVMGRFDGVQAGYMFYPKWKISAVAGSPTEPLFDSSRHFYGVSLDTDSLLPNLGGSLYAIQQIIDGEVDRRAVGVEMRFFKGGASVFSQFDYDLAIKALNISMIQGTLIQEDNTVYNLLYDRRALTMMALGNALTFEDPNNPGFATRIQQKLSNTSIDLLREQIKATTPYVTQAMLGVTKPLTPNWQLGGNIQLTNTGEIPPVPGVSGFEQGRPATGNIYSLGAQVIGLNLYSTRDTHVFATNLFSSPSLKGYLLSYNNSSVVGGVWQLEPSLQYYSDRNPDGGHTERWTPGLRATYRNWEHWALELQFSYEIGKSFRVDALNPGSTTEESSKRVNFSLGARREF